MFLSNLCLVLLFTAESYGQEEEVWPRPINITVLNSQDNNQCPLEEERERGRNETETKVRQILMEYGETTAETTTETISFFDCNGTPGWRQVAFIDMTDTSYNCPPGLNLTSLSKRTCGRAHANFEDCSSTTFSVGGSEYSQVCGRIRGYQVGTTVAFRRYFAGSNTLSDQYVDGVSLTHGLEGQRQHIWTFAAGLTEATTNDLYYCPCDRPAIASPPFVGDDYFCESGTDGQWGLGVFYQNDPLWDGQGCSSTSTCCQFNNPPWFTKVLPNPTTDDIELRICLRNTFDISDVPLELIELYIQ